MTDQLERFDGALAAEHRTSIQRIVATSDFLNTISTGMIFRDRDGEIVDCNAAAEAILGVPRDRLLGRSSTAFELDAVRLDGTRFTMNRPHALETLVTGQSISGLIAGVTLIDRSQKWLSARIWPHVIDGEVLGVMSAFDDVTAVVKAQRIVQIMAAVRRVGLMTVEEADALQLICDLVVSEGHVPLAWIGAASEEGGVDILASSGATDYLYDDMVSWWGSDQSGHGPTGSALRTGASQVANDLSAQPRYGPWKKRAHEFGLLSSVALPFALEGRRAVISIYEGHVNAFDEKTVSSLEEVAMTMATCVATSSAEFRERTALEATFRRSRTPSGP